MADEALRELLAYARERHEFSLSDAASEQWVKRADALESALSELARLRAERDTGMFHSQSDSAKTARDHPTDE